MRFETRGGVAPWWVRLAPISGFLKPYLGFAMALSPLPFHGAPISVSRFGATSTAEEVADGWDGENVLAIVTGPYAGLGLETARVLVKAGAEVVMAGRSRSRGEAAIADLRKGRPGARLRFMELDVSSLDSVERFAKRLRESGEGVNVLINNAGVGGCDFGLSADGHEMHFATNHLGHFLLTRLLMPCLEAGAESSGRESRVVNVTSVGHFGTYREGIRFGKIDSRSGYRRMMAYGQSKLANILFTRELEARCREAGKRVVAVAAHPGIVRTEVWRHTWLHEVCSVGALCWLGGTVRSIQQGAATQVYLATAKQVEGGEYYADCAIKPTSSAAVDRTMARRLWEVSEAMCGDRLKPGL